MNMNSMREIVMIVDDDASFLRSTARLLRAADLNVETFDSAIAFLKRGDPESPACLVLDVHMAGISGLELQRELQKRERRMPIIFLTGQGDIPMSVQAMKAGATEFLTKPFREEDLINAVCHALEMDRLARADRNRVAEIRTRYEFLTKREREVFAGVVLGMLNKQIAAELGTTEKTIKFHRAHMMQKMNATSVPSLVGFANALELNSPTAIKCQSVKPCA